MRVRWLIVVAAVAATATITVPATHAALQPGPRLAYSSSSGSHIEVLHPDRPYGGTLPRVEVVAVAADNHWLTGPSWSPTGRWLTYGDTFGVLEPVTGELRIVNVATRRTRTVLTLPTVSVIDVAWSPRGDRIAFATSTAWTPIWGAPLSHRSVHVVDVDGSDHFVVGPGIEPDWSPDGRRLAYTAPTGVTVVALDDMGPPRPVGHPLDMGYSPRWSPDGRRIAFLRSGLLGASQIWVADADGTDVEPLSVTTWTPPSWSPDSRFLAYADRGLAVIAADGTGPVRRLHWQEQGTANWPAWAPHGLIAWVDSGEIRLSDPATGDHRPIGHRSPDPWMTWAPAPAGG